MSVISRERLAQHYWKVMQAGLAETTVHEFQGELDDLSLQAQFSDSPVLAALCQRNIHRFDGSFTMLRAARAK